MVEAKLMCAVNVDELILAALRSLSVSPTIKAVSLTEMVSSVGLAPRWNTSITAAQPGIVNQDSVFPLA